MAQLATPISMKGAFLHEALPLVFVDGFESGDTSAWGEVFTIEGGLGPLIVTYRSLRGW